MENHLKRKIIMKALLTLNVSATSFSEEEQRKLQTLIAITFRNISRFSQKGTEYQDNIQIDNDFFMEKVIPVIEEIISFEVKSLPNNIIDNDYVEQKFCELLKRSEQLMEHHNELVNKVKNCAEVLREVLQDEQWPLQQKIASAEVDNMALKLDTYEKKFDGILQSIDKIYRSYQFDKAVDKVSEQIEKEIKELQIEKANRNEKLKKYLKALKVSPQIDNLLERYNAVKYQLEAMQECFSSY